MRREFAVRRSAVLRSLPLQVGWSSCEARCLLRKHKSSREAQSRVPVRSGAASRAAGHSQFLLPRPRSARSSRCQVDRWPCWLHGFWAIFAGSWLLLSVEPVPRHRALCDRSVQSCFVWSRCRGSVVLRVLLAEFAGLLQQVPHFAPLPIARRPACSAHLRCRRCIDGGLKACAVHPVSSVRIHRFPDRCVTCRPGLSVRTVPSPLPLLHARRSGR